MMIPGRRIAKGETVFTSPFPRGGDGLFLRIETIDMEGTPSTSVKVWTRNKEDDWPTTGPLATLSLMNSGNGVDQVRIAPTGSGSGIKEELRLEIANGSEGDSWQLIRVLAGLFYDDAKG